MNITCHNSNLYAINNNKLNLVLYQSCSNSFFKDNLLLVIVISNNLIDGLLSKIYTCHDCIATFKHKMTLEQKNPWFLFSFLHFYTFAPDDGTRVLHLTLPFFSQLRKTEKRQRTRVTSFLTLDSEGKSHTPLLALAVNNFFGVFEPST